MPAKDIYHDAVKNALIKDGWRITADPYFIIYKKLRLVADLGAERSLSAQKGNDKIVIEVKSFLNPSFIYDLERAVGQYIIYRNFLKKTAPDHQIYLALSQLVYQSNFDETIDIVVKENEIKLIIVDTEKEVITKWIN
ncbi:element excision factor XisH family protein [Cyanobacterium aponinum UTEX 3221]|uniref:element excision factor XisH family protein n=1 Tax=Cyanobacterium aponinum TaxID=379064 RepID=UPI002B4BE2F3|nr:element excision factor XisH family protein [Cyanobacterium aponinum]WRL38170.1 element excision factor XisH family protein [Cyanobacterium aponinum UTEX 3221]